MKCPNCGSERIRTTTHTSTNTVVTEDYQGYGFCRGVLGWLVFGPIGLLCGLCGMGDGKRRTDVYTNRKDDHVCLDCGRRFS